jgi:methionyl-tRNA formyltransferase
MRAVFVGGTKRGFLTIRALIEHGANIVGVIILSQDEHEAERYEEPIRSLAVSSRIPLFETKWMKERD